MKIVSLLFLICKIPSININNRSAFYKKNLGILHSAWKENIEKMLKCKKQEQNMIKIKYNSLQRKGVFSWFFYIQNTQVGRLNRPLSHLSPYVPLSQPFRQLPFMWWHCFPFRQFPHIIMHSLPYVLSLHSVPKTKVKTYTYNGCACTIVSSYEVRHCWKKKRMHIN